MREEEAISEHLRPPPGEWCGAPAVEQERSARAPPPSAMCAKLLTGGCERKRSSGVPGAFAASSLRMPTVRRALTSRWRARLNTRRMGCRERIAAPAAGMGLALVVLGVTLLASGAHGSPPISAAAAQAHGAPLAATTPEKMADLKAQAKREAHMLAEEKKEEEAKEVRCARGASGLRARRRRGGCERVAPDACCAPMEAGFR